MRAPTLPPREAPAPLSLPTLSGIHFFWGKGQLRALVPLLLRPQPPEPVGHSFLGGPGVGSGLGPLGSEWGRKWEAPQLECAVPTPQDPEWHPGRQACPLAALGCWHPARSPPTPGLQGHFVFGPATGLSFAVPALLRGVSETGFPRPRGALREAWKVHGGWGEGRCDQESSLSQSLLGSGTQVPAQAAPRSRP